MYHYLTIILVLLITESGLLAQQHTPSTERVDPTLRRRTEIDGNNVRTSVFNFAFSGRTGGGQGVPYEWPKNTGRYYVALVALLVGGEVVDDTGRTIRVVDLPAYRQNLATGGDWNMGPVPGYFNLETGKIAKSDEPNTWPDFWPDKLSDPGDRGWRGSWNGYFGKNQFSADQEMFYRVGDDNYNRFLYTPDTTDRTRRGLGIITDVRVMEWSQVSVADAVFFIQAVKNDGTKEIKKAAVTLWLADFVGGDGDSNDDKPDFDLIRDIAFSLDNDGLSSNPAFRGAFVGAAATLYLETPGNAQDQIDNDGDGEQGSPLVTGPMLLGEIPGNQIDDNGNTLIDEDSTYIPFGQQAGVGFADHIDNNDNGESGSPVVTNDMLSGEIENNATDDNLNGVHDEDFLDIGKKYKDGIDNNGDGEQGSPVVTLSMVVAAASNNGKFVVNSSITLYELDSSDVGKKYADGIDNDNNFIVDEGIDEDIDEMVDEGRNDFIDNDHDWSLLSDDVGLDGAANTNDVGEGDGKPTSGVGTPFPGEPNIDKTDVSEADQIGLTNVQYLAAGAIDFSRTPDVYFWAEFMIPGSFVNPAQIPVGESDLFVSSGVFPMKPGQIERISYAIVFGSAIRQGNATVSGAKDDAMEKRKYAQLAYDEDYQFAQAPIEPRLKAVAGDGMVTLYWDNAAESSIDRFLAGVPGALAQDFEGYRIYRATDPAFEDARIITDANGSPAPWLKPIAQFDLVNGIKGFDSSFPFNGTKFDLGQDNGIVHSWIDRSVKNGQKYYYAIRAYDRGYLPLRITPAESNLKISIDNVTGEITNFGTSVAIATPEASVAGYIPPDINEIKLITGSTTGFIGYDIINPNLVPDNHTYRITFTDTVIPGGANAPDVFKTTSYTLADITDGAPYDTVINQSTLLLDTDEQPMIDGFKLVIRNEKFFGVNPDRSRWSRDDIWPYLFQQWKSGFTIGLQKPSDYKIVFGPLGVDTSISFVVRRGSPALPAKPVNFKVYNTSENREIDFAFFELDNAGGAGIFSARKATTGNVSDVIIFVEPDLNDSLVTTWSTSASFDSALTRPTEGDTLTVVLSKLFRSSDVFEFTTSAQYVDLAVAKTDLRKVKVVPNPYIVTNEWEEKNSYSSGRGPRAIHFNHLPQKCTIRIYNVNGELVTTIDHESDMLDGSATWNLLTRDNLAVSYGIYVYHIDAPGVGEHVGKFAIIK
jgi:hypothetical protein